MKSIVNSVSFEAPIATPDGEFLAAYSATGLCRLQFPSGRAKASQRHAEPLPERFRGWHQSTTKALVSALAGEKPDDLPPLDLSAGTDFQQLVWKALRRIRSGRVLSYSEIARAIGRPKAVRAVGGACGANPIPVLVPCHRVLAANQKIGGFSGGLGWKKTLLGREGIVAS